MILHFTSCTHINKDVQIQLQIRIAFVPCASLNPFQLSQVFQQLTTDQAT